MNLKHPDFTVRWKEDLYFTIQSSGIPLPLMALSARRLGDMGYPKIESGPSHQERVGLVPGNELNREKFLHTLGIPTNRLASVTQIHSKEVVILPQGAIPPRNTIEGDGLICQEAGVFLSVTVADCLPIFLFSRNSSWTCMLHSGWRGTGIVKKAIEVLGSSLNIEKKDCIAVIGPGIGSCCYRVSRERADFFEDQWGSETVRKVGKDRYLDLKEANRRILAEEGIGETVILPYCTSCDGRFGSFRREGPSSFTRMLALIGYFE